MPAVLPAAVFLSVVFPTVAFSTTASSATASLAAAPLPAVLSAAALLAVVLPAVASSTAASPATATLATAFLAAGLVPASTAAVRFPAFPTAVPFPAASLTPALFPAASLTPAPLPASPTAVPFPRPGVAVGPAPAAAEPFFAAGPCFRPAEAALALFAAAPGPSAGGFLGVLAVAVLPGGRGERSAPSARVWTVFGGPVRPAEAAPARVVFLPPAPLASPPEAAAPRERPVAGSCTAVFFATMAATPSHIVNLLANRAGTINRLESRGNGAHRPIRPPAPPAQRTCIRCAQLPAG
ncbi:hypothetical protein BEK98_31210 [Streptomyces diastatochromogenes]|uniref:Uncharacterized protein n=1 Tax=Streptomyces diastatochromogenes TaxID=42236 RepID=A0A233S691_STRDA|nr:hypothetical protein BEK98_31210 [Streptomyces diastatochromogenes]